MKMTKLLSVCTLPLILLGLLVAAPSESHGLENQWTNAWNDYWGNDANWSLGHVPLPDEDVIVPKITSGMGPGVFFRDAECRYLFIGPGTEVEINDRQLTVNGDMSVDGDVQLSSSKAKLVCKRNVYWFSGSRAFTTGSSQILVSGTWDFKNGADVQLENGWVHFVGDAFAFIRSRDSDSHFNHVRIDKNEAAVIHSSVSTAPLKINGNLIIGISAELRSNSSEPIEIAGYIHNEGGTIDLQSGTVEFLTGDTYHSLLPGDHFNNVIVNAEGPVGFDSGIDIGGNLSITSGLLVIQKDLVVIQ